MGTVRPTMNHRRAGRRRIREARLCSPAFRDQNGATRCSRSVRLVFSIVRRFRLGPQRLRIAPGPPLVAHWTFDEAGPSADAAAAAQPAWLAPPAIPRTEGLFGNALLLSGSTASPRRPVRFRRAGPAQLVRGSSPRAGCCNEISARTATAGCCSRFRTTAILPGLERRLRRVRRPDPPEQVSTASGTAARRRSTAGRCGCISTAARSGRWWRAIACGGQAAHRLPSGNECFRALDDLRVYRAPFRRQVQQLYTGETLRERRSRA